MKVVASENKILYQLFRNEWNTNVWQATPFTNIPDHMVMGNQPLKPDPLKLSRIQSPYWILLRKVRSPRCGIPTFEARKATTNSIFSLSHIHTAALPPNTNTRRKSCSYKSGISTDPIQDIPGTNLLIISCFLISLWFHWELDSSFIRLKSQHWTEHRRFHRHPWLLV